MFEIKILWCVYLAFVKRARGCKLAMILWHRDIDDICNILLCTVWSAAHKALRRRRRRSHHITLLSCLILHKAGFNFNLSSFLSSFSSFSQWYYSVTSLVYWQDFWHLQKSKDRDREAGGSRIWCEEYEATRTIPTIYCIVGEGRAAGSGRRQRRWRTAAGHSGWPTDRRNRPEARGGGARRRWQLWPQLRRHTSLATKIAGGGTFGLNIAAAHIWWRGGGGGGAHGLGRWRWRGADSMYVLCCYEDTYWQTRLGLFFGLWCIALAAEY